MTVNVGLVFVLKIILNVAHLVVNSDKILIIHDGALFDSALFFRYVN